MAVSVPVNSLISDSKSSDSRLQVQLHPLVILTISDYITRHILRQQQGPIVGAILGSQHGRDITMEHAFECKLEAGQGGDVVVDASWFESRLQQFKDVHKAAALDFVGWFTLASAAGPEAHHLPIHQQFLNTYNDSALLLLFHPSEVASGTSRGGKLPLTIYESVLETVTSNDGDKQMSGGDGPQHSLRFQELPYTIETGEAEMISVDFVARGGANATAIEEATPDTTKSPPTKDPKGKGKASGPSKNGTQTNGTSSDLILSPEDEDHIALLTAKSNAIRMLQQRISLLRSYLNSLPDCYLTQPLRSPDPTTPHVIPANLNIDHQILRQISALLARLPLLTATSSPPTDLTTTTPSQPQPQPQPQRQPHPSETYTTQSQSQSTDIALTSLLSTLGTTLSLTQRMGRKFAVFENSRSNKESLAGRNGAAAAFGDMTPRGFGDYGGNANGSGGVMDSEGEEMDM